MQQKNSYFESPLKQWPKLAIVKCYDTSLQRTVDPTPCLGAPVVTEKQERRCGVVLGPVESCGVGLFEANGKSGICLCVPIFSEVRQRPRGHPEGAGVAVVNVAQTNSRNAGGGVYQ